MQVAMFMYAVQQHMRGHCFACAVHRQQATAGDLVLGGFKHGNRVEQDRRICPQENLEHAELALLSKPLLTVCEAVMS